METATVGEVTSAMMDEAAHNAVEAVEAMAHEGAIHPAPFGAEKPDEPVPRPADEAMSVEPVPSGSDAAIVEPEPSAAPDLGSSPTGSTALTFPDASEMAAFVALPSLEASEPMALVKEPVTSMVADSSPAEEAFVTFQGDIIPPPGLHTTPTEAFERTDLTLRPSLASPGDSIGLFNAQMLEMLASNVTATGQFLSALLGATSVTEVVAVNTHHLRRQMELLTSQGRQLTTLARTIALDAMKPFGPSSTDHVQDR